MRSDEGGADGGCGEGVLMEGRRRGELEGKLEKGGGESGNGKIFCGARGDLMRSKT